MKCHKCGNGYIVDYCEECDEMPRKWIKVSDRLPDLEFPANRSVDVLTYCISDGLNRLDPNTYKEGEIYMAIDALCRWKDEDISFRTDKFFGKVTHWMPLPPIPPRES